MEQDKRQVDAITSRDVDFAQWYTDVCRKAELIDYTSMKGMFILRPYGYAIWENIENILDAEFKKTGHTNVSMPLLIPESLLQKEKDHVKGFAPECAWVTMGGNDKLEERLCIRPTSETLFCDHWAHIVHSWRDLPMLYNQWCSVLRWEKTTVLSCAIVSFCGRKGIRFMPRLRRPSTKQNSSWNVTPVSARTFWLCPWFAARRLKKRSLPVRRLPTPSNV